LLRSVASYLSLSAHYIGLFWGGGFVKIDSFRYICLYYFNFVVNLKNLLLVAPFWSGMIEEVKREGLAIVTGHMDRSGTSIL